MCLWVSSFNSSWSWFRLKVCLLLRAFWAHIQYFRLCLNRERWKHRYCRSRLLLIDCIVNGIFDVTIWHALFLAFVLSSFSAFCFCLANGSCSHRFVIWRHILNLSFLVFSFYLRSLVVLLFFHFNFSMIGKFIAAVDSSQRVCLFLASCWVIWDVATVSVPLTGL